MGGKKSVLSLVKLIIVGATLTYEYGQLLYLDPLLNQAFLKLGHVRLQSATSRIILHLKTGTHNTSTVQ